ncbi:hypothetical protein CHX26_06380 [Porphyrobacter sp. HT-58-2]|nr:hypothetical protein CHX26_06380 [Porphyrobacter sp. HT-58-2]
MTKAGLMNAPKRGVWGLTEAGRAATLTSEQAAKVFQGVQAAMPRDEDEQQAPDETNSGSATSYWFVGAVSVVRTFGATRGVD